MDDVQIISYWKRDGFHGGQYMDGGIYNEWWNPVVWSTKGVPADGKPFGDESNITVASVD